MSAARSRRPRVPRSSPKCFWIPRAVGFESRVGYSAAWTSAERHSPPTPAASRSTSSDWFRDRTSAPRRCLFEAGTGDGLAALCLVVCFVARPVRNAGAVNLLQQLTRPVQIVVAQSVGRQHCEPCYRVTGTLPNAPRNRARFLVLRRR